jgi:hypothetical protein
MQNLRRLAKTLEASDILAQRFNGQAIGHTIVFDDKGCQAIWERVYLDIGDAALQCNGR